MKIVTTLLTGARRVDLFRLLKTKSGRENLGKIKRLRTQLPQPAVGPITLAAEAKNA